MTERLTIDEIIAHCERVVGRKEEINSRDFFETRDMGHYPMKEYWEHRQVAEYLEELKQYRAIGTVEELRELKEKATAKKPTDVRYFGEAGYYIGLCPTCKSGNNSEYEYCGDCGQKLLWD